MQVEWYGQSAFRLTADTTTVFIDPFGDMSAMASRGLEFNYPPIAGVQANLLLITHEHRDHNAADVIGGSPAVLRSTAGRLQSPVGEVLAIASEHDQAAGTERGPNSIFVFEFDGIRVCHFGDFGQGSLRDEQAVAIDKVDLLFIPVGGGPTIGAEDAVAITNQLEARWVVPMHYRTERVKFLEGPEEFLEGIGSVHRVDSTSFDTAQLPSDEPPVAVVPKSP
jgi:L-ascorbate metabolism protein UlaG (beta-lactamase superfamily)